MILTVDKIQNDIANSLEFKATPTLLAEVFILTKFELVSLRPIIDKLAVYFKSKATSITYIPRHARGSENYISRKINL